MKIQALQASDIDGFDGEASDDPKSLSNVRQCI